MSTTTPLPAPGLDPAAEARGYSAAVRAELADLPPEVVEELTGGLEADLAELAAETSTPLLDRLGSPRGYAAELRAAAGLAGPSGVAAAAPRRGFWERTADGIRDDRERLLSGLRGKPWWPGAVERAEQLRPAWWVLRGALAGWVLSQLLDGHGLLGLLVVLAAALASVEVGRRRWTDDWQRVLLTAGNALAVVVLPFALLAVASGPTTEYVYPAADAGEVFGGSGETSQGVWFDGQVVTNIYPYDAQGRPLTGIQLLDDYGRPLTTSTGDKSDWSEGQQNPLVPAVDVEGAVRWNAYPLRAQTSVAGSAPTTPPLPEQALPPLLGVGGDGTGAGGASTADPTATAEPAPASTAAPAPASTPTASDGAPAPAGTTTAAPMP